MESKQKRGLLINLIAQVTSKINDEYLSDLIFIKFILNLQSFKSLYQCNKKSNFK